MSSIEKSVDCLEDEENDGEVAEILDNVEKLSGDKKEQAIAKLEMYYGPIPHPDILFQYDKMDKGAAKQIIDNGVAESVHRRSQEKTSLIYAMHDNRRRDWMGFTIGLFIIGVGAYLISKGFTVTGTIMSGVSGVMLVSVFASRGNDDK